MDHYESFEYILENWLKPVFKPSQKVNVVFVGPGPSEVEVVLSFLKKQGIARKDMKLVGVDRKEQGHLCSRFLDIYITGSKGDVYHNADIFDILKHKHKIDPIDLIIVRRPELDVVLVEVVGILERCYNNLPYNGIILTTARNEWEINSLKFAINSLKRKLDFEVLVSEETDFAKKGYQSENYVVITTGVKGK